MNLRSSLKRVNYYSLLIAYILFSCTVEKEKAGTGFESNLVLADSLILHLDTRSTPEFNFHQVSKFSGNESLINLNLVNKSLDFFSLSTGKMFHRISFSSEGPGAVADLGGFYYLNEDSIFVFQKMSFYNTALMDSKGIIHKKYSPIGIESQLMPGLINHFSNSTNPTYFVNKSLYFDQGVLKDTAVPGVLAEEYQLSGKVNLTNDTIILFPNSGFPNYYVDKALPIYLSISSRILDSNSKWIYSWNALDSILVYDLEMNNKRSIYSKSKYKINDIPSVTNTSLSGALELVISNTHYVKIIYDPHKNKYIRFAQIGRTFDPAVDNNISAIFKNDFSVMIYDENWELQDEYLFAGSTYNLYHSFVGEKGLYLAKTNPFYKNLNEDEVVFEIYEIK